MSCKTQFVKYVTSQNLVVMKGLFQTDLFEMGGGLTNINYSGENSS